MRETDRKPSKIRVFLVDDHPIVREGLRTYLSSQRSVVVVGEASDDKEALRKVKRLSPDIIVLDISLPGLDGGELARHLRQIVPCARIIAFSMHASEEYVVRMARCGVRGYVMKDEPTAHLLEAIIHVSQGGLHFPSNMTDAILLPWNKPFSARSSSPSCRRYCGKKTCPWPTV